MGNGQLLLPVRAEVRKKIGKKEGDRVHVVLYADNEPAEIPEELLTCLKEDSFAFREFMNLTEGEKKSAIDWIYAAKREETRIERIAGIMNKLTGVNNPNNK